MPPSSWLKAHKSEIIIIIIKKSSISVQPKKNPVYLSKPLYNIYRIELFSPMLFYFENLLNSEDSRQL